MVTAPLLLAALLAAPPTPQTKATRLSVSEAIERIWPKTTQVQFSTTTVMERKVVVPLVQRLWRGVQPQARGAKQLRRYADRHGFVLHLWQVEGQRYWALLEKPNAQRGAGAYVFRVRGSGATLLQAPHAYYDRHTGAIAAHIFFSGQGQPARALFTNTQHRYRAQDDARKVQRDRPSDVCHNPNHLFTAATHGVVRAGAQKVIQIHGFGAKDKTEGIDAVVSGGVPEQPTPDALSLWRRLRAVLGPNTTLYPRDVKLLGATSNVQGRLVRNNDGNGFVHIELAPSVRQSLLDSPYLRGQFAAAVLQDARAAR